MSEGNSDNTEQDTGVGSGTVGRFTVTTTDSSPVPLTPYGVTSRGRGRMGSEVRLGPPERYGIYTGVVPGFQTERDMWVTDAGE